MRKFLSLVLALAMAMSLVVVNTSAKEFTDSDDMNYKEAVDVISEIGVVDGYDEGNFNPQGYLSRGAAAKIICNLILGPTTAAELHADTRPFSDVAIESDYAGFIAYCSQQGIISGYADGEFKPYNKLTGYAFMKMLLGALGYDQNIEQFVGENWSINVAKQAIGIGLNAGLVDEFNGVDYVTREEAALYAFNTLKATMVDYDNKISANVNGAEVVISNNTAKPVDWKEGINEDGNIWRDGFVQFAEEYFPDLVRHDDDTKFMEPANTWTYDKTEIGTYERVDLLVTDPYTTGVSGRDLYDLLKSGVIKENDFAAYLDGADNEGDAAGEVEKDDLVRSHTDDLGGTGNGVLTKVYLDTDKELITLVSINTYLAEAVNDYSESNEYATLRVYKGVTGTTEKSLLSDTYNVDVEEVPAVADVTSGSFYAVNISYKDDRSGLGEVVVLSDVEILEDSTISEYSSDNGNTGDEAKVTKLTTGGEEYSANEKAFYDDDILYQYNENLLTDNTYNVYLDQYGYFLGVDLFEGTKNYVFITGFDRNTSNLSVKTATATGIFLDGTMENIQVNVTDTDDNIRDAYGDYNAADTNVELFVPWATTGYGTGDWAALGKDGDGGINNLNQWYTYTVDANGTYTLKPCVRMTWTQYDKKAPTADDTVIRTDNLSLLDNFPANVTDPQAQEGTKRVYGEDATVFLTVDLDIVDTTDGIEKAITDVNGVYTGVQSVNIIVDRTDDEACELGQVYTVYDSDGYVIAAVVIGEAQGATGNYAYILSEAKSERNEDGTYSWTFDAVYEGAKQTLRAQGSYTSTIANMDPGDVVELRFDGDVVTNVKPIEKIYNNYSWTNITDYNVYYMSDRNDTVMGLAASDPQRVSLQGNTLYITERMDQGLGIARDAKAVVIQDENGKKDQVHNFNDVLSAVNYLVDEDKSTPDVKEYSGVIMAVLNDSGAAEWVVFDSDTPLVTGTDAGYERRGNVSGLVGDLSIDLDKDGTNDITLDGSSANITYRIPSTLVGMMYATMDYTAPEWVADGATVDVYVDVLYNGVPVETLRFTGVVSGGKALMNASSANPFTYTEWEDVNSFAFRVNTTSGENADMVKVMYFDDTLTEITSSMSSTTDKAVNTGAAQDIYLQLPNDSADTNLVTFTWTGVGGGTPIAQKQFSELRAGMTTPATLNVTDAAPVTVVMDLSGQDNSYSVTTATGIPAAVFSNTGSAPVTGVAVSSFGADAADDAVLKVWTTAPANSLKEYNTVRFQAQITDSAPDSDGTWTAAAYDVRLTLSTGEVIVISNVPTGGAAKQAAVADIIRMPDGNVTITGITVTPKPMLEVLDVVGSGNTITVTFNTEIASASPTDYAVTATPAVVTPLDVDWGTNHKTVVITLDQNVSTVTAVRIGSGVANALNAGDTLGGENWTVVSGDFVGPT